VHDFIHFFSWTKWTFRLNKSCALITLHSLSDIKFGYAFHILIDKEINLILSTLSW
jgi:hypothetical protein